MKSFKRNAVILTVLLFVCAAVYLNWTYGQRGEEAMLAGEAQTAAEEGDADTAVEDAGLYYTASEMQTQGQAGAVTSVQAYFDTVRLSREQSRSSARETLLSVSAAESAAEDTVEEALASVSRMAEWAVLESTLEGEIMAKGYDQCVVFITEKGITVTVPAPTEGLSQAAVARITDTVLAGSDFDASALTIVEVK